MKVAPIRVLLVDDHAGSAADLELSCRRMTI